MLEQDERLRDRVDEMLRRVREQFADTIMGMLGPQFEDCSAAEQSLTLRYDTALWQRNGRGLVHGGITASLFDQTMGTFVYCLSPDEIEVMTAELSVSYLRPIPAERTLLVKAVIKSFGRTMVRVYGELFVEGGEKPCASASSILVAKPARGPIPVQCDKSVAARGSSAAVKAVNG